jgi:hypothetical protein
VPLRSRRPARHMAAEGRPSRNRLARRLCRALG